MASTRAAASSSAAWIDTSSSLDVATSSSCLLRYLDDLRGLVWCSRWTSRLRATDFDRAVMFCIISLTLSDAYFSVAREMSDELSLEDSLPLDLRFSSSWRHFSVGSVAVLDATEPEAEGRARRLLVGRLDRDTAVLIATASK